MYIKKNFQGEIPANKIMGTYTESDTDTYGCNYINFATNSYSTEEKKVGIWINGKPIYKKTVSLNELGAGSRYTYYHNISNFENIIKYEGMAIRNDSLNQSIPAVYFNDYAIYGYDFCSSYFRYFIGAGFTGGYALNAIYITLYYTKTTD